MDLKTIAELQLFEQFPRDQQFLNFGCSFIDARCPHIAIKPFHDMSGSCANLPVKMKRR